MTLPMTDNDPDCLMPLRYLGRGSLMNSIGAPTSAGSRSTSVSRPASVFNMTFRSLPAWPLREGVPIAARISPQRLRCTSSSNFDVISRCRLQLAFLRTHVAPRFGQCVSEALRHLGYHASEAGDAG